MDREAWQAAVHGVSFPLKWPSPLLSQCALRPQTSSLKPSLDRACYTLVTTALEGFISWVDTGHIQQPDHLGSPLATILTLFSYTISLLVLTLPFLPWLLPSCPRKQFYFSYYYDLFSEWTHIQSWMERIGLPWWSSGYEFTFQCRGCEFESWSGS